jgi:hypothetical protein
MRARLYYDSMEDGFLFKTLLVGLLWLPTCVCTLIQPQTSIKFTLEQVMKAQRESRDIALLFL